MRTAMNQARKRKRLTQEELAERLGVTRVYISMVERGKCDPSLPLARNISRELHVEMDTLFGDNQEHIS